MNKYCLVKSRLAQTVDWAIEYRYGIVLMVFFLMVALHLHGFSLMMWDYNFPSDNLSWYLGKPRAITSDVWGLVIPQILSQAANGFPLHNPDLMSGGMNAVVSAHLPVLDISVIVGQPVFWGFYLFGVDAGLAWYYWFRVLGILLTGFELIRYLTKNGHVALLGGILLSSSPIVLWWGGHILPEILLYAQGMLAGGICFMEHWDRWRYKILAAVVVLSSSVGFVLMFYPALQVPLGILVLLFAGGVIWEEHDKRILTKENTALILLVLASSVLLILRLLYLSWTDIQAILSTSFPGKRFTQGGGGTLLHVFYSLFQWLLPFKEAVGTNNCEASMFIPVWGVVLLGSPFALRNAKQLKPLVRLLYGYFLFCLSWLVFQYPAWFAKFTLFSNVIPRLIWVIGTLSIYLFCVLISQREPLSKKRSGWMSGAILLVFLLALQRGGECTGYITEHRLLLSGLGLGFVGVLSFAAFRKQKRVLLILCAAFVLVAGATVNPLMRGADAITSKQLSATIQQLDKADPDAYWAYDGAYPYGNFLSANGVRCFNATNYYMDPEKWTKLDPQEEYEEIYNRYAQISLKLGSDVAMKLIAPDLIEVTLNAPALLQLGLDYIVSNEDLSTFSAKNQNILQEISKVNGVWIYQVDRTLQESDFPVTVLNRLGQGITPVPLTAGTLQTQTFTGNGAALTQLDVIIGTYARVNQSSLHIRIANAAGTVYESTAALAAAADNAVFSIALPEVETKAGVAYTITLEPINANDLDFIAVYCDTSLPQDTMAAIRLSGWQITE